MVILNKLHFAHKAYVYANLRLNVDHFPNQLAWTCWHLYVSVRQKINNQKAIPVTGRGGPNGSETLRFPHFLDDRLTDGGEFVSLTRRPSFTPTKIPGTHFYQRLSRTQGHSAAGRITSIEKSNDLIGNRTRDLPSCIIVAQSITLPSMVQKWSTHTGDIPWNLHNLWRIWFILLLVGETNGNINLGNHGKGILFTLYPTGFWIHGMKKNCNDYWTIILTSRSWALLEKPPVVQ
jgi:hypothetical protein